MLASDLYAQSQNARNQGPDGCHWCGAACSRVWRHDEQPPSAHQPLRPRHTTAKRPGNAFICCGCWLYRRQRVTVNFLTGGQKDVQCPVFHSWWITSHGAWALRDTDFGELYKRLLKPPLRFVLALREDPKLRNDLHLLFVNDHEALRVDTELRFSIDHTVYNYTVYDLEMSLKLNQGMTPGTSALLRRLGAPPAGLVPVATDENKKRGRPPDPEDGKSTKAPVAGKIAASGALAAESIVQNVSVLPSGASSR